MDSFEDKEIFELTRTGSYGRFTAANSFPVDFVLSSFDINDVKHLMFARELHADKVDFEMMMQRDIDEDRSRRELAEYLYPTKKTEEELKSNIAFFPPLLVAILHVEDGKVCPYYPKTQKEEDGKFLSIQWGNCFKLRAIKGKGKESYPIEGVSVKKTPVEISLNVDDDGAKLIVIDGQHRLFAIKDMLESEHKSALKEINIPVCIVFPPKSTKDNSNNPKVTEVFRHLFVDVNSTMEQVGGHFTILLKDNNLGSIAIRKWCDTVLKRENGAKLMSAIEWNTKSKKDSTILTKKYSVTSIGIIHKCLEETIVKSSKILKYIFGEQDIEWNNFDLTRKREFEELVQDRLTPLIDILFFNIDIFKAAFDEHNKKLTELEKRSQIRGGKDNSKYKVVYNSILNASPIPDEETGLQEDIYNDFIKDVSISRRKTNLFLVNYALFQRSIFLVWKKLIINLQAMVSEPSKLTELAASIINRALSDDLDLFSFSRKYCQYTIWSDGNIKNAESTKNQFCNLILSVLTKSKLDEILKDYNIENKNELSVQLLQLSEESVSDFLNRYKEHRRKAFKVSFINDSSIDDSDLEELYTAQKDQERLVLDFKQGKISKDSVSYPFDEMTEKFIEKDVTTVTEELKQTIGFNFNPISK